MCFGTVPNGASLLPRLKAAPILILNCSADAASAPGKRFDQGYLGGGNQAGGAVSERQAWRILRARPGWSRRSGKITPPAGVEEAPARSTFSCTRSPPKLTTPLASPGELANDLSGHPSAPFSCRIASEHLAKPLRCTFTPFGRNTLTCLTGEGEPSYSVPLILLSISSAAGAPSMSPVPGQVGPPFGARILRDRHNRRRRRDRRGRRGDGRAAPGR